MLLCQSCRSACTPRMSCCRLPHGARVFVFGVASYEKIPSPLTRSSRTFVLLMALMALVVSSVNAEFLRCGKCLIQDSRIETRLVKKEFRITDEQKEAFCLGEFGFFGGFYEVIRPANSRGRCKVACRYLRPAHFSLRRFGRLQTEALASTFADAKRERTTVFLSTHTLLSRRLRSCTGMFREPARSAAKSAGLTFSVRS